MGPRAGGRVKIHVTGGAGFIAGHLVRNLREHGHQVSFSGSAAARQPQLAVGGGTDLVIHAGARVGRERCASDQAWAIQLNVASTVALAEACARANVSLLLVSSAEVYGLRHTGGRVRESDPLGLGQNLYALTKRWAEDACRLIVPSELLTIARLGMQYGPGSRGNDTLTTFLRSALQGEELRVYRQVRRSWTYVGDTARALSLLAEASQRWRDNGQHSSEPAIFNVDSNHMHEMSDAAERVIALTGSSSSLVEENRPQGYSDLPMLDTSRIRTLGWQPQVCLDDGIRETCAWLRDQLLLEKRQWVAA